MGRGTGEGGEGEEKGEGRRGKGREKQPWLCSSFSVCLLNENLIVQP